MTNLQNRLEIRLIKYYQTIYKQICKWKKQQLCSFKALSLTIVLLFVWRSQVTSPHHSLLGAWSVNSRLFHTFIANRINLCKTINLAKSQFFWIDQVLQGIVLFIILTCRSPDFTENILTFIHGLAGSYQSRQDSSKVVSMTILEELLRHVICNIQDPNRKSNNAKRGFNKSVSRVNRNYAIEYPKYLQHLHFLFYDLHIENITKHY